MAYETGISWRRKGETNPPCFEVFGGITETTNLLDLASEIRVGGVVLDLAGISAINSTGLREWLRFIQALEAGGKSAILERCSLPVVTQINIIRRFTGPCEIRSVFGPYVCPACDAQATRLFEVANADPLRQLATPMTCPECQTEMEFDDIPESYFAFLSRGPG